MGINWFHPLISLHKLISHKLAVSGVAPRAGDGRWIQTETLYDARKSDQIQLTAIENLNGSDWVIVIKLSFPFWLKKVRFLSRSPKYSSVSMWKVISV